MFITSNLTLMNAKDTFCSVLEEARNPDFLYSVPAYISFIRLATLNGKLPFRHAIAGLVPWEASCLMTVMGNDALKMIPPTSEDFRGCNILVTHSSFGKLSLYRYGQETPSDNEVLVGGLQVETTFLEVIENECRIEELSEKQELHQIDTILCNWEKEGCLREKIEQVIDWVDRVESVYIYIRRQIFARSDVGGNTLNIKPGGILRTLISRPLVEWTEEERLFIVAAHLLFQTGRAIRFEEFNGRQLTAMGIRRWLTQKLCAYSTLLAENLSCEAHMQSLLSLAAKVGQLALRVDSSGWVRFRRINGISFVKNELLLSPEQVTCILTTLPTQIANIAVHLRVKTTAKDMPEQYLQEVTRTALYFYLDTRSSEYIHRIIEQIVLSAVV